MTLGVMNVAECNLVKLEPMLLAEVVVMQGGLTARGVLAGVFVLRCSHDFLPVFPALLTIVECLLSSHFLHPFLSSSCNLGKYVGW